jgi:hypothetical protein
VFLRGGHLDVVTVAGSRGRRPWSDALVRSVRLGSRGPARETEAVPPLPPTVTNRAPERPTVSRPPPAEGWSEEDLR